MYELVYFASPGLIEGARLCLATSSLDWTNTTVDWEGYLEMKERGDLPWGLLPILRTPEGTLAESKAILRYTGALAGIEPEDLYVRAKVDELIDVISNWRQVMEPSFRMDDIEEKVAARRELFADGGGMFEVMRSTASMFASSPTGKLAGTDSVTIADIKAFTELFGLFSGQFDGITKDLINGHDTLLSFHSMMANEPLIQNYYDSADDSRWMYKPGSFD